MDDLYVKNADGSFTKVRLEVAASRDLEDKLIIITVGNDKEPASTETLEYVKKKFMASKVIIDALNRSKNSNMMILPHIIKFELVSKKELEAKNICVRIETKDNITNLPEIKKQLKNFAGKDVVILPTPLSIKEYEEIKAIKERIRIRKERHGGGTKIINK